MQLNTLSYFLNISDQSRIQNTLDACWRRGELERYQYLDGLFESFFKPFTTVNLGFTKIQSLHMGRALCEIFRIHKSRKTAKGGVMTAVRVSFSDYILPPKLSTS